MFPFALALPQIRSFFVSAWRLVRRYWYVVAGILAAIIGLLFSSRRAAHQIDDVFDHIQAAKEEEWIQKVEAVSGRDIALDAIKSRYVEEAKLLNEKEQKRAKELQENPTELARLLLQAGRKHRSRTRA